MRVFITGGTGMIGSHVAERLRARGDDVVGLVRTSSDTRHLESIGCDLVVGDMLGPAAELAERMRGADAVVHAAAKVFQAGSREEFLRVNSAGTERVLEAAALAAPRVVHVSSVAVYSGIPLDRPATERRWEEADPERQPRYAASKHLAERAAWRVHEAGKVRVTTVRPCVVYGERDRSATPVLVRYASLPIVPLLGGGRTTIPVVYAGNVAAGILAALDRDASVGRAYNLADDLPITARQMLDYLSSGLGRRRPALSVPAGLARALAPGVERLSRVIPGMRTLDARRAVASLTHGNPYDSARARLELGWSGLVAHEEGVRRTMEWWRGRD